MSYEMLKYIDSNIDDKDLTPHLHALGIAISTQLQSVRFFDKNDKISTKIRSDFVFTF